MIRGKGHCNFDGHRNTMGTASTRGSVAEALGRVRPDPAGTPTPDSRLLAGSHETEKLIVDLVRNARGQHVPDQGFVRNVPPHAVRRRRVHHCGRRCWAHDEQPMKAFVIAGPGESEVQDVEAPAAEPGQVVVDVERVAVCGTDLELFTGEMAYLHQGFAKFPMRIGPEWCGTVSAVGPGVDPSGVGRRTTGGTPCWAAGTAGAASADCGTSARSGSKIGPGSSRACCLAGSPMPTPARCDPRPLVAATVGLHEAGAHRPATPTRRPRSTEPCAGYVGLPNPRGVHSAGPRRRPRRRSGRVNGVRAWAPSAGDRTGSPAPAGSTGPAVMGTACPAPRSNCRRAVVSSAGRPTRHSYTISSSSSPTWQAWCSWSWWCSSCRRPPGAGGLKIHIDPRKT